MKLKRVANSFQKTNSEAATNTQARNAPPASANAATARGVRERVPSGHSHASRAKGSIHHAPAARS